MKVPLINHYRILNEYDRLVEEYREFLKQQTSSCNFSEDEVLFILDEQMRIFENMEKLNNFVRIAMEFDMKNGIILTKDKLALLNDSILEQLEGMSLKLRVIGNGSRGRKVVLGPYADQESYEMLLLLHRSREANFEI